MNWRTGIAFCGMSLAMTTPSCMAQQFGTGTSESALMVQQGVMTTLAGTGTAGYTGDGGAASSATVTTGIRGIAADASGDVFFVDATSYTIRVVYEGGATAAALIEAESSDVTPVVGDIYVIAGKEGSSGTPSSALATSVSITPGATLGIDAAGDVYFSDTKSYKLWVIYAGGTSTTGTNLISIEAGVTSPVRGYIYAIAGGKSGTGYAGDGALATSSTAAFNGINDVKFDASGNAYIADQGNNAIRKISASTGYLSTVAGGASGAGTAGSTGAGGPATSALLNAPYGVALDAAGDLYIADKTNHEVKMVYEGGTQAATLLSAFSITSPTVGDIYVVAGGGKTVYPYKALAISSVLSAPTMVALDAAGDIYISDNSFDTVIQVNALTGIMTAIAGTNSSGYSGDGGPAISAAMSGLRCVAVDAAGRIYVTDASNARIREISQGMLEFVGEAVGVTSSVSTITLINAGNATLNFSSSPVFGGTDSGDFAIDTSSSLNTCDLTSLAPGATCKVAITYTPTATGIRTATLSYTTNGIIGTQVIYLEGLLTPTTTGLAASTNSTYPGQSVVLTATVSATEGTPTGTVTFYYGTTVLETESLPSTGIVTYTVGPLALGAYTYSAVYSGDTSFATSTSDTSTVDVGSFTLALNNSVLSVAPGQSTQVILTITGSGPVAQVLSLSCSGPNILGCAFSPTTATVPASGSLAVTVSVAAVATTAQSNSTFKTTTLAFLPLGALLLFGLRKRRISALLALAFCLLPLGILSGCMANNQGTLLTASTQSVVLTVTGTNGNTYSQALTMTVNVE